MEYVSFTPRLGIYEQLKALNPQGFNDNRMLTTNDELKFEYEEAMLQNSKDDEIAILVVESLPESAI